MWGVVEVANTQDGVALTSFKPMQAAVNLSLYKDARRKFQFVGMARIAFVIDGV
jgi:ATP-dependent Lon protease